ncbi:B3 domain-containing protein Os03g0212300-like [Olea europaea var. sylvestris]|uniref:B3 domain-containing protein Os03g0212300-like n=1 Tax=Olea europaea var. sylvestris TaxID=158386 RepID=UPI000C1CDD42|nr:B3 domain-containing protein Os03g0212300-like [Olea europaea var. sylvestris]
MNNTSGYDGIIATIQLEIVDNEIYLTGGWELFFNHHNLQDGYVIVFEYIGNSTFKVSIFDASRLEVTYDTYHSDPEVVKKETFYTGNPVFRLTFRYNDNCKIYVPLRFNGEHLPKFIRSVRIHDSSHRNWTVSMSLTTNGDIRCFTTGWSQYDIEKQLQIRDTYVFEHLSCYNELLMFMVHKVCNDGFITCL